MAQRYESWGRVHKHRHQICRLVWRSEAIDLSRFDAPILPFGLGRSYGDSCLNDGGYLLDTTSLDRFIAFDPVK